MKGQEVKGEPPCATCGHPKSVHEPPLPGYVDECEWCSGFDWRHPYQPALERGRRDAVELPIHVIRDDDTGSCLHATLAEADVCTACRQPEKTTDQLRTERERLTDQLYSADPTDQVDAYLTLQAIEDAESQPPGCGWLPGDATIECDWDPNCPVHGRTNG